jgi:hypothetical protein
MTPSPMMASSTPSPFPSPSLIPNRAAPKPPTQSPYPPGPSAQYGAHPAPQAQGAPYPSQQYGYSPGQPSAAYPTPQPFPPPSSFNYPSNVYQPYGGVPYSSPASSSTQYISPAPFPSPAVPGLSSSSSVKVKLAKEGKFAQLRLDMSETIESFKKKLFDMYGCDVVVEYTDPQHGTFTILSSDDVKDVFSLAQKQADGLLCLNVSTAATSSSATSSTASQNPEVLS